MIIGILPWIDLLTTVREMRILSIHLWPTTREMLRHCCDTLLPQLFPLKSPDVRLDQVASQLGIFTKRQSNYCPAVFRAQISLRMQRKPQAHGQVLPSCNIGELLDQVRISKSGKP